MAPSLNPTDEPVAEKPAISSSLTSPNAETSAVPSTVQHCSPHTVSSTPEAALAYHAARAELSHVVVAGITVHSPVASPLIPGVSTPSSHPLSPPLPPTSAKAMPVSGTPVSVPSHIATLPPSSGFVLTGTISLFGDANLPAKFAVWEGAPPAGIIVPPGSGDVSVERATLPGPLDLSSIFPQLDGTALGSIVFKNISILHQSHLFDKTRSVGWHLDAEMVIDGRCGTLHEALITILDYQPLPENKDNGVDVAIHAELDAPGGWAHSLDFHQLILEGVLEQIAPKPLVNELIFTKVGVRLQVNRSTALPKYLPSPLAPPPEDVARDYAFDFAINGTAELGVPNSVLPLKLDYEIRDQAGGARFSAKCNIWDNPLGVKGLTLRDASFTCQVPANRTAQNSPPLTFSISASFVCGELNTTFAGSYTPGAPNSCDLTATINGFSTHTLATLFTSITGRTLSLPSLSVDFTSTSLHLCNQPQKGFGLAISLDKVTVGTHISLNASLEISSHNVVIQGTLTSPTVTFGDVDVKNAHLRIEYVSDTDRNRVVGGRKTEVTVGGDVVFSDLTLDVAVYLYSSVNPKESGGFTTQREVEDRISTQDGLQWTVVSAVDDDLALSKIIPEVHGTFLDLALKHVVFVAASCDNPDVGNMITSGYQFHQGIQICATLDDLGPLNSLARSHISGLTLTIVYCKQRGFQLSITPPTPALLSLGHGITTTPLKPSVQTSPPRLTISTDVSIPLPHSAQPLVFDLILGVDLTGASGTSAVERWWTNPLGIGENVKIGPKLMLSLDIIFAQFVTTGSISGFGIQGGIMIGDIQVQALLRVNEDPMKEFLEVEADALNLVDIVSFTQDVTGLWMPQPPRDFLTFEKLKIYICPANIAFGAATYPAGCSFTADMLVFEKKADVSCKIESTQLAVEGEVDGFELGPLKLCGKSGPRASVSLTIGVSIQQMSIDGMITLFDDATAAHVELQVQPQPKLSWFVLMKFTDVLTFQLNAQLVGGLKFTSLSNEDFTFDALLQQDILQHLNRSVIMQLAQACRAADEGLEQAQEKLTHLQKEFEESLRIAETDLERAYATWQAKDKNVRESFQPTIDAYDAEITKLRADIGARKKEYDTALKKAQQAIAFANREREQRMAVAQRSAESAERKLEKDTRDAQARLDRAQADMDRDFGLAQQDVKKALQTVQTLSTQIDRLYGIIRPYEHAPQSEFWVKAAIPGLYADVAALEASKVVADGVLEAAEAVINSAGYLSRQNNLYLAHMAVDQAEADGHSLLKTAKALLQDIDNATQAAVRESEKTWEVTQQGIEWAAFQTATVALDTYQEAHDATFQAAQSAIEDLSQSVEYLAYRSATATLDAARSKSTLDLQAAQQAVAVVEATLKEAVSIGKWIAAHLSPDLLNIRLVHITGRLSEVVDRQAVAWNPLTAHVEGSFARRVFSFDCQFDPRRVADFITAIFKRMWDEVGRIV